MTPNFDEGVERTVSLYGQTPADKMTIGKTPYSTFTDNGQPNPTDQVSVTLSRKQWATIKSLTIVAVARDSSLEDELHDIYSAITKAVQG